MTLNSMSTDEQVLAAFRDPARAPSTTEEQLMIVGTGGLGLWERHWGRYTEEEHPGAHRAMRFVKDISRDLQAAVNHLSLHHYRLTPEGIAQREQFPQVLQRDDPPNPLDGFVKLHPNDWDTFFRSFKTFCEHGLHLSQHLAFIALMEQNPALLTIARTTISKAVAQLHAIPSTNTPTSLLQAVRGTLRPWTSLHTDTADTAFGTDGYIKLFNHIFRHEDPRALSAAADYIAISVTVRYAAQARRQNAAIIAGMPKNHDRIPTAMRELGDEHLRPGIPGFPSGLIPRMEQAITSRDVNTVRNALEELRDFQEGLLAVAFASCFNRTQEYYSPYPAQLAEIQNTSGDPQQLTDWLAALRDDIPEPSCAHTGAELLQDLIALKARGHFDQAARSVPPTPDNQFHYNFHQGIAL